MARSFTKTSLSDAVGRLAPGMKVLLPPGCGEPTALVGEICRQSDRLTDLTLMGGVHLGDYRAARPEHASLAIATWQMSPRLEEARRRGRVTFVPIRYFDVVTEFREGGRWAPDCVIGAGAVIKRDTQPGEVYSAPMTPVAERPSGEYDDL